MKITTAIPLLLLPLAGATAYAAPQAGSPVPLDSILGDSVLTGDGRDIGEVEDVLLRTTGELEEYLIDFEEPEDSYNNRALTLRDDVADYDQPPYYEGRSVEGELQADHVAARPEQVVLDRHEEDVIVLELGPEGVSGLPPRDDQRFAQYDFVRASDLVGMELDLADAESFGSVETIALEPGGDAIAAYVIDSWEGLDRRRVALPPDAVELVLADARDEDHGVIGIRSHYTRAQMESLPEFDPDR